MSPLSWLDNILIMVAVTRGSFVRAMIASTSTLSTSPMSRQEVWSSTQASYAPAATFVRQEIATVLRTQNPQLAGSMLRLAFHDAAVRSVASDPRIGGADGSVRYELDWPENRGLGKPLRVVQDIYDLQREKFDGECPAVPAGNTPTNNADCRSLSFADTLALAGAASVEAALGPAIRIRMGRADTNSSDQRFLDAPIRTDKNAPLGDRSVIDRSLPSPALDSLGLRLYFRRLGMTDAEFVALSGAHDLGRHVTLTGMPKPCLRNLTRQCLEEAPVLAPFVAADPDTFSHRYFQALLRWNDRRLEYGEAAFLPTDVALVVDGRLRRFVVRFAKDEELFFRTFRRAYQKLVDSTATSKERF